MSAVRLELGWIAAVVNGTLTGGDPSREVAAVVTDSRVVAAGDLFIALRGERFDAHTFLPEVWRRQAAAAIVEPPQTQSAPPGAAVIEVASTLRALQDLARAVRKAAGSRVVAITGSAGKTTTKEAIAACLSARFRVVRNKGNLNNHIGLPLSLLDLRSGPDVAVMELGMNHAGEIRTLVAIAEPDVRVWTNVGDAHLGFFASPEEIADAKAEILERADAGTLLVCNADDPRIMARIGAFPGRVVTFGSAAGATLRVERIEDLGLSGTRAILRVGGSACEVRMPLPGRGNLANAAAAAAVAVECGVSLEEAAAAIAALRAADRRGVVKRLRDGIRLVDDSYNSSPSALRQSLDVLARERESGRTVAVLGEMLELGAHAMRLHEECGRAAAAAGVARLFVIGGEAAKALGDAAVAAGLPAAAMTWFARSEEAAPAVAAALQPGDVLLVKGSRGTRTDIVADRVEAALG